MSEIPITMVSDGLVPCAIYIRVSTDEQAKEEHYSLAAQEEYCMAEIRRRSTTGWFYLVTLSDPGFSGNTFDRPGLLELIALVKAKKVGAIIVYKRERLFRNADLAASVQAIFDLHTVKVLSCVEGLHDSSPHSVLMRQIIDANAQFERANGRKRQHDCLRYAASQGDWKGGSPPLGYAYQPSSRVLEVCEGEAELVRSLFEQVAAGRSLHDIAVEWRRAGVRGRGNSNAGSDPSRRPFLCPYNLKCIIRLPIYRGIVRVRKLKLDLVSKTDRSPEWEEFKGKHQPLVSDDVWWRANRVLEQLEKVKTPQYRPRSKGVSGLLQGVLRCDCCDYSMSPGTSQPKHGSRIKHRYYRCVRKVKGGKESLCTTGQVSAYAMETAVMSVLQLVEANPAAFVRMGGDDPSLQKRKTATMQLEADIVLIEEEIVRARNEVGNLLEFIKRGEGALTTEAAATARCAKEKLARNEAERIRLQSMITRLSAKTVPLSEFGRQSGVIYRAISVASYEQRIPIFRSIFRGIKVRRVAVTEPEHSERRVLPARVFRLQIEINTNELMRFGTDVKANLFSVGQTMGHRDMVLSVTIQIRTNAKEQKVMLLEHGYTTVSVNFSELQRLQSGVHAPLPVIAGPVNPIQRALRWKVQLESSAKTLTQIAVEQSAHSGCNSTIFRHWRGRVPGPVRA